MRGGGGAGQAGIAQLPAQLLAGGIIVDVGGAGRRAGVGWHLRLAVERRLHLVGESRPCKSNRCPQRKRDKHGLVRHGGSPFDVVSASKQRFSEFMPETPTTPENFVEAYGAKCVHTGQRI